MVLLSMAAFSFAISISPGPVNLIILSSGVSYGYKRTFSFVSGATIGFTFLLLFVGLGFIQLVIENKNILMAMTTLSSLFIIYMGLKVAFSDTSAIEKKKADGSPPTFFQGFMLQWLNPKAWAGAVSGVSIFSSSENTWQVFTFIGIYFILCYACLFSWAILGDQITRFINSHAKQRIFNIVMGSTLVLVAIHLGFSQFYPIV